MEIIRVIENQINEYSTKWLEQKKDIDFEILTTLCKLYSLYKKEN